MEASTSLWVIRRIQYSVIFGLFLWTVGCQSLPFGPHYTFEPIEQGNPARVNVTLVDERPAWQKEYWQGAESPRDHAIAISVVPLERLRPISANTEAEMSWLERLKSKQSAFSAMTDEIQLLVAQELDEAELAPHETNIRLTTFIVVVNKSEVAKAIWEKTEDERREAIARHRRESLIRTSLGIGTGLATKGGTGIGLGTGLSMGSPNEMPELPGERNMGRTYGIVRGPPAELGEYDSDVTCEIKADLELWIDRDEPLRLDLHAVTRSLPLSPPSYDASQAIPSTARQALLELGQTIRQRLRRMAQASNEHDEPSLVLPEPPVPGPN